jgi:hypothetical protein
MTFLQTLELDKRATISQWLWLPIYVTIVSATIFLAFSHWAYDDPFITYRYAYNLTHGLGFVYNPGEKVLSTTTPLFTVLLAGLSLLWGNLPRLANLISATSLAIGAIFLWNLAHAWKQHLVGWVSLLLYPTFSFLLTTTGSETPLYLMFCLGAFAFYARRRYTWTASFAALAILTRPDGILVPAILAAHFLFFEYLPDRSQRSIPWVSLIVFFVLTLPWFIFAWRYFGSPLPVTLAAKQHQGAMADSQRFVAGFIALVKEYATNWLYLFEFGLAFIGLIFLVRRARPFGLLISWVIVYFAAYAALGVSGYYWYYAPLVPGFVVLVGLGVAAIKEGGDRLQSRQIPASEPHLSAGRFSSVLTIALIAVLTISQFNLFLQVRKYTDNRVKIYRSVGNWLRENSDPDATVGSLEIGVIGYYAHRPMIDFAGLLYPKVADKLTANSSYAVTAKWVAEHMRPDYFVLQDGSFGGLEQGYIARHCEREKTFPGKLYGYALNLQVYKCR